MNALIEAWFTNCAQTVHLLDILTPEQWEAGAPEAKPIRSQFAHIHNVRLMLVKMADKSLLGSMTQADRRNGTKDEIRQALLDSACAIAALLDHAGSADARIPGLSRSAACFLASVVAHDAYHRGQIELILRQSGLGLSDPQILHLWDHAKMTKYARELFTA